MTGNETTTREIEDKRNGLEYLGDSLIELGNAVKNKDSKFIDLCRLANRCGLDMQFRLRPIETKIEMGENND